MAVNEQSEWNFDYLYLINLVISKWRLVALVIQQYDYKDRFTVFSSVHNTLDTNDLINREVI